MVEVFKKTIDRGRINYLNELWRKVLIVGAWCAF